MAQKPTLLTRFTNVYVPTVLLPATASRTLFIEKNRGVLNTNAADLDLYFRRNGSVSPNELSFVAETVTLPGFPVEPKQRTAINWLYATHTAYQAITDTIETLRRNAKAHTAVVSFDKNTVSMQSLHEIESVVLCASAAFYNIVPLQGAQHTQSTPYQNPHRFRR